MFRIGFGLFLVVYGVVVLCVLWLWLPALIAGCGLVIQGVGAILNGIVIRANNERMPVVMKYSAIRKVVRKSPRHCPLVRTSRYVCLSDIIPYNILIENGYMSIGDMLIWVGEFLVFLGVFLAILILIFGSVL